MSSIRPSAAVTGIAAGKLALAFRGLKALAPRGERSSHCPSYLPIRAFLIIASNPMLVLEFSWPDWLLQLINPGRYGRGERRKGVRSGQGIRKPNKRAGWGGWGGGKATREEGRNKQSARSCKRYSGCLQFPRNLATPPTLMGLRGCHRETQATYRFFFYVQHPHTCVHNTRHTQFLPRGGKVGV